MFFTSILRHYIWFPLKVAGFLSSIVLFATLSYFFSSTTSECKLVMHQFQRNLGLLFREFLYSLFHSVTAKKCYFEQEPDHEGKLRWVMPLSQQERCSCTVILPGGVNRRAPKRPYEPYYTDQPLFTDDVEEIHDYFDCHEERTMTTIKTKGKLDKVVFVW